MCVCVCVCVFGVFTRRHTPYVRSFVLFQSRRLETLRKEGDRQSTRRKNSRETLSLFLQSVCSYTLEFSLSLSLSLSYLLCSPCFSLFFHRFHSRLYEEPIHSLYLGFVAEWPDFGVFVSEWPDFLYLLLLVRNFQEPSSISPIHSPTLLTRTFSL